MRVYLLIVAAMLFAAASATDSIAVPMVGDIVVDGRADDWEDSGFRVEVMGDIAGYVKPARDFDAACRIGWTSEGLALLFTVTDNVMEEQSDPALAMLMDAVRIAVSNPEDASDAYAVVVTAGTTPDQPEPRWHFIDRRKASTGPLTVSLARSGSDTGYTMEVLLPWTNMGADLKQGDRVGLHVVFSDNDFPESLANFCYNAQWPVTNQPAVVTLARRPAPPVSVVADRGRLNEFGDVQLGLTAPGTFVGMPVSLKHAQKTIASGVWKDEAGRATCVLTWPLENYASHPDVLRVVVGGKDIGRVAAPDVEALRRIALKDIELAFMPSVFNWPAFPDCRLREPVRLRQLIGPYALHTTFYDRNFNPVDSPEAPGRYAAVVEIRPEHGEAIRRFRTLLYLPDGVAFWDFERAAPTDVLAWPESLGFDADPGWPQQAGLVRLARRAMVGDFFETDSGARFLAGAMELRNWPDTSATSPTTLTDQWWVDFKRRYHGLDEVAKLARPQQTAETAPGLRYGAPEEAGMDPAGVVAIRRLCDEWARGGEEPFSVCLARNGVVFLHEGFGALDGAPMSVDEPRAIASVYKLVEAVVIMMLVDQGTLALDVPIAGYLPALEAAGLPCSITLRHLFTHTSGLEGHWGWDQADLAEVIAGYCAHLRPGERFDYTTTAYVLAERVAEAVSGTAFATLQQHGVNDPLGLAPRGDDPDQMRSIDLARLAQMLLNGGAYGSWRFMSPETAATMVPQPLTRELGPMTEITWGIGTRAFHEAPSSPRTWGQSGYSGTFVCIDPDNQLIVVMARSRDGNDVMSYRSAFFESIAQAIRR